MPIFALMRRPLGNNSLPLIWLLALGLSLGLGCAGIALSPGIRFAYFEQPAPDDPWSGKIAGWQSREKAEPAEILRDLPAVAQAASPDLAQDEVPAFVPKAPVDLRTKYSSFLAERKRELARAFAAWVQTQAKQHYVADGPIDHWATLEETLKANGDDCDGLELLTFQGLRELGFGDDEVFRAIVYRPSDGQHHMVTLWFETPDDPWVIDPTGAMTVGMPRMSEMPAWVPLKVFGDTAEYTVRRDHESRSDAALASN
jgi:hypothetical protein